MRPSAAGLTLLVHACFALLLLAEARVPPRPLPAARQPAGVWIHLPPAAAIAGAGAGVGAEPAAADDADTPADRPALPVAVATRPATAITQPPAPIMQGLPAGESGAPAGAAEPADWHAQSARHAARAAEELETATTFSPPPAVMREPCRPRKSSFEWKDKPPKDEPEINPLGPPPGSVMMGGTRVGVAGISIALGAKPEPNRHLFDDMQAGRTPHSSVPHPHYCD